MESLIRSGVLQELSKVNATLERYDPTNTNLEPERFFQSTKQTYIPLYALDAMNGIIRSEPPHEDFSVITYYKPTMSGTVASKLTSTIIDHFFNLNFRIEDAKLFKVVLQFNNNPMVMYVGAGIILDEQGKVLCSLVVNKEILDYMNSFPVPKYRNFAEELFDSEKQNEILNIYGSLLVTREFSTSRKYKNIYSVLSGKLLESETYKLDLIITNNIESKIFNIGKTTIVSYNSIQEKVAFQKDVWRKVLT